ncbi:MAG TPA: hypothetical protein VF650_01635 [Allosphingosinicella sp.]
MTGLHANWWALIGIVVAVAIAVATIELQSPGRSTSSPGSGSHRPSTAISDPVSTPPNGIPPEPRTGGSDNDKGGSCDSLYAIEKESQFRRLIEAEVGKCVQIPEGAMQLYFSCTIEGANRNIVLKHQMSDAVQDHVIRMSAAYAGPAEVDLSQVKLTPLNRGLEDACAQRRR